jgi:preprotein translocase subunit SecG
MYEILLVVFLVVSVALIGLILIQHGKGADMGASFGAGASGTVFGSAGSANFLTRTTAVLATLFFVVAMSLAYMVAHRDKTVTDVATEIKEKTEKKTQEPLVPVDEAAPSVDDRAVPADEPATDSLPQASSDNGNTDAVPAGEQGKEQKKDDGNS